jgi:hypothetical protein
MRPSSIAVSAAIAAVSAVVARPPSTGMSLFEGRGNQKSPDNADCAADAGVIDNLRTR